ncbi:MAG TPA: S9 family peptidase [Reyranella sp.]|nr:S9 family peptidase [Reyranella sp.]
MAAMKYRRRTLLLAGGATALTRSARAQQAKAAALIPRRLLFSSPERARVAISPNGKLIGFLAPLDGVANVFVAPVDNPEAARPLTKVTDRDVKFELLWPCDNRHLVFFRDQGGDENWQGHRIDVETGEIKALTPGPGVLAYVQQTSPHFPGELLIGHNQRDKRYFDVYRVNVATAATTPLYQNNGFSEVVTDPHFQVRYGIRFRADGGWDVVHLSGDNAGALVRSIKAEDAYTTQLIEFSDDDRELFWLDSEGRDTAALVAQDLASGHKRVLAEDHEADCGGPVLDPLSKVPIAAPVIYTRRRWTVTDPAALPDLDRLQATVEGDIGGFGMSDDRAHWIVYAERSGMPGRFFHYDRAAAKVNLLFAARPALEKMPLQKMEPVVVTARDELKLVCYLTRAIDAKPDRPGPTVLLVHGGPWGRDMPDFNSTHQWLANRGYNVLSVNYRSSLGFGKKFVNAGDLEWARKIHDDLLDAVSWAVARRIADAAKVAIYGASYGGYSALVGATFTPDRFACAIDLFGISNLVTFAKAVPPYWGSWAPVLKTRMGDYTTEQGRQFLLSRSPISRVDKIVRPLLIGQGANDVRVTPAESEQIVAEMQKRKIPVTYVYYKDEGHGFHRAENRQSFTAVVEAFLGKHLGGRVEPVGDDFKGSSIEFKAGRELIPGMG